MPYEIDIQNEIHAAADLDRLRAAAETTLTQQAVASGSALTVVLVSDGAMADLNSQFRGIAAATDVLSFPADAPPVVLADEPPYLGDILIAPGYAAAQAQGEGHRLADSLALLVVHGTLHLLGYDHDTPEARARMWAAQEQALRALGIPLDIAPALEG